MKRAFDFVVAAMGIAILSPVFLAIGMAVRLTMGSPVFFRQARRPVQRLPVARELGESSLMFLVHPTLSREHMEQTCSVVRDVVNEAVGATRLRSCI